MEMVRSMRLRTMLMMLLSFGALAPCGTRSSMPRPGGAFAQNFGLRGKEEGHYRAMENGVVLAMKTEPVMRRGDGALEYNRYLMPPDFLDPAIEPTGIAFIVGLI